MMPSSRLTTRHSFFALLNLLFCVLAGTLVFTIFGMLICAFLYNTSVVSLLSGNLNIAALKIIQLFSAVGTFIIPAFIFARQESSNAFSYLKINEIPNVKLILLAVITLYAFTPFIEWTILVNQQMNLPQSLQGLENWMQSKEQELELLTKQFLVMKTPADLLVNMFIIAILPGIGEELIFRGCLQRIIILWTKNYHAGIWIAAIIFSAIHVQFYGFLPRMLLGALFGYLFYWSKNLLILMIAHFVNNGTAVVSAYILQQRGKSIEMVNKQPDYPDYMPIVSFIVGAFLLIAFYKISFKQKTRDEGWLG